MSTDILDLDRAIAGDLWVVQETEDLQRSFNKMVGGLVNDQEDEWVKGPAKMSADFIHLCNNDSTRTVYSALIRIIKKRRYRYVSRVKKSQTSIIRDKEYWRSPWGILLREPSVKVPGSYYYKRFRRRFRIPFELFYPLVEECKQHKIFDTVADAIGTGRTKQIPIEFKVLASMRMLGRDYYADDVTEILNCGEETARSFMLAFIRGVSKEMYTTYVYVPEGEELDAVEEGYRRAGLPGCLGSMDCTHVIWDRAAKKIANQCKQSGCAKTLSFEVVVDHCRRIHHVSKPFYGTTNDKRVMAHDTYPFDLVHNRVHAEREFRTYNSLGEPSKWQGAWLITDNGYSRSMSLQCPDHHTTEHDEVMFAEWLESMRKDIECIFGILKGRFCILKNAIRLKYEDDIEALFRTCAVLHNILLQFDGFLNPDWLVVDPNIEEPEEDPEATQPMEQIQDIRDQPLLDATYQPTQHEPDDQIIEWNQDMFFELRAALVKNLAYQFRTGRVE